MVESVTNRKDTQPNISPIAIERILTGWRNPQGHTFEESYPSFTLYQRKYDLVKALIQAGRYSNVRFLIDRFIVDDVQPDPEIEVYKRDISVLARELLIQRGDKKEKKAAEDKLRQFVQDVEGKEGVDIQQFKQLVRLFGSSNSVDILYMSHPEYRGVPREYVKSVIADYLGDFLITRGEFSLDDIEIGLEFISNPDLRGGLTEVVKDDCYTTYNKEKRSSSQEDSQIIAAYFNYLKGKVREFQSDDLDSVVKEVEDYYKDIFTGIDKPSQLVDFIKEGRAFPDLPQRINTKEIKDKKRILIADEMGMGKSASAIFAKEHIDAKLALVIAPSNVLDTWLGYLSDKVDDNGDQMGYFKPGFAPRVLVVNSPDALVHANPADYGYVLISQERLNDNYTDLLNELDYDMLIVDEIHKLKNLKNGKRAANLVKLAANIESDDQYLVMLSGTPVPNKIQDVAILLKLLYPDRFAGEDDQVLISKIINGDLVDLRNLLLPRMQMKSLTDSIEMPSLNEKEVEVELSPFEKQIYEVLLEEDEITASEKLIILRQFLLNPSLLDIIPTSSHTKIQDVNNNLSKAFQTKNKVVMFVNNYIEGVIRGTNSILSDLQIPEGVEVRVIEGNVDQSVRSQIQHDLNNSNKRMLVVVSGQTSDVGVDFSGGQAVLFYNEPWTKYEKRQELSRVYRPGIEEDIESTTFITKDTIEEGIHKYIEAKYKAIKKLLVGIPITEIERDMLKHDDDIEKVLEVNPELAEYYFTARQKMMKKIFPQTRELGEEGFRKFLSNHGQEYADCYLELGVRSYHANASRVSGTLIDLMARERGQIPADLTILDIASGPEMLRAHMLEEYSESISSLDLNPLHFSGKGRNRFVGSFLDMPFENETFDYENFALAWHYTNFGPRRGQFERLQALREIHRTLKTGGKAVLNLIYSLDLKDDEKFREVAEVIGFRVLDEYSGQATNGMNYSSRVISLEKQNDFGWTLDETVRLIGPENYNGLKFKEIGIRLKDSQRVMRGFQIEGRSIATRLNAKDMQVLLEEERIVSQAEHLRSEYGSIDGIPRDIIIQNNFVRLLIGKRYALFKKLATAGGVVLIK